MTIITPTYNKSHITIVESVLFKNKTVGRLFGFMRGSILS